MCTRVACYSEACASAIRSFIARGVLSLRLLGRHALLIRAANLRLTAGVRCEAFILTLTLSCQCPEAKSNAFLALKADIWAFGVMLLELISAKELPSTTDVDTALK